MQGGCSGENILALLLFPYIKERAKSMKNPERFLIGILICVIIGSVFYIGYYYVTQNKK